MTIAVFVEFYKGLHWTSVRVNHLKGKNIDDTMNQLQAELFGMHAGDGTLYRTNRNCIVWELRGGLDEKEYYIDFVSPLLKKLFDVEILPKHRSGGGHGSFGVQTANKAITSFLSRDFPVGEKSSRVRIPDCVLKSTKEVQCAFIRGLFDTDGCIRFDKNHTKRHYYPKIELSSLSEQLRDGVRMVLDSLDIGCYTWDEKKRSAHRLCVPGKKNLEKWMMLISWHNPKHLNKIARANVLTGGCAW